MMESPAPPHYSWQARFPLAGKGTVGLIRVSAGISRPCSSHTDRGGACPECWNALDSEISDGYDAIEAICICAVHAIVDMNLPLLRVQMRYKPPQLLLVYSGVLQNTSRYNSQALPN